MPSLARPLALAAALLVAACSRAPLAPSDGGVGEGAASASPATSLAAGADAAGDALPALADGPRLAAIGLQVPIYERPTVLARKLGYLRIGAIVGRDERPVSTEACPGGWYRVHPRGFICVGDDASLDPVHPIARAASVRPRLDRAMPYAYGFVRAVAPLYLRVPSEREQLASEFKLKEHLDWWRQSGLEANRVIVGANDVPIDARGVPIAGAPAPARLSTSLSQGELFGGETDHDPIPFWLEGGRKIANVSGFQVPPFAVFANRVRRHTGLAFVGSFAAGPEAFDRRFAVTIDLRLVPITKVKPDTGSAFHGLEIDDPAKLPFAFVRAPCAEAKRAACIHVYRVGDESARETDATLAWRSIVPLSGKSKRAGGSLYRETRDGRWLKASELGVVEAPAEPPPAAKAGQKWIDISIDNETLVLWEGQKPVYATLVSAGQDGMKDPKTTKSTVRGVFHIRQKHVTTTMDSNERSAAGGGPAPAAERDEPARGGRGDDDARPAGKGRDKAPAEPRDDHPEGYGRTVRRGQGSFELRDVPWVEYFDAGYALHTAYWHDVFGVARSHGCVNLAPVDAHRVFFWTDPPVPEGWHGVTAGGDAGEGTTVSIHK